MHPSLNARSLATVPVKAGIHIVHISDKQPLIRALFLDSTLYNTVRRRTELFPSAFLQSLSLVPAVLSIAFAIRIPDLARYMVQCRSHQQFLYPAQRPSKSHALSCYNIDIVLLAEDHNKQCLVSLSQAISTSPV